MRIRIAVPEEHVDPTVIDAALEAVTRLDESMIRQGQSATSHELIARGAEWRPEPPGDEHFDHGGTIESRGWGDCDDWAPLHAGSLRASGEDPGAIARVISSGPNTYHAIVERSDGSLEDPSAMAGMQGSTVVGGAGMAVWACDPHDGRIYTGSLAPTVGPLAVHCGGAFAIRGAMLPDGPYYEARADMPLSGSPLCAVRSSLRGRARVVKGRHVRGERIMGAVPYALACVGHGRTPIAALDRAITGAILCGDAAELTTALDRYKLLAMQAAMAGHSPGEVRAMLVDQITHDVHAKAAATGTHPEVHTRALAEELAGAGYPIHKVSGFFDDIGKIASGVVSSVSSAVNAVAKVASQVPWGDIVHDVQAAVSVVPGLGTAVSDVVAAAETAYDSAAALLKGDPLEAAVDAAYNFALASVPGADALRPILDPIKTTLMNIVDKKEPVESAILDGILAAVPDSPSFGSLTPRSVTSSIAHLLVGHLGVKKTPGHTPSSTPSRAAKPVHPVPRIRPPVPVLAPPTGRRPAPPVMHPLAKAVLASKPPGVAHAAVHADAASLPGTPGAPPGATHWTCMPVPGGQWACRWI
jgi:hypothetical protein